MNDRNIKARNCIHEGKRKYLKHHHIKGVVETCGPRLGPVREDNPVAA